MRFDAMPILETERLILRPIVLGDDSDIFAYAHDPAVTRLLPWGPHSSIDETKAVIEKWIDSYQQNKPAPWGIVEKKSNRVIGTIEARIYAPKLYSAELGYCLSHEYWGKGIMVETVKKVIEHLFSKTNITEITAHTRTDNIQSQRVLEKAGLHKGNTNIYKKIKGVTVECTWWTMHKNDTHF